jgi:hypothetical protein
MKILNPNYVKPIAAKETKIRGVITAYMTSLSTSDRSANYQEISAAIIASFPALNFDRGDIEQAARDLGYAVESVE